MPTTLFNSSFSLPPLDTQQWPALMQDTLCPTDRPLALLPVRLETRFFAQHDGSSELRIRVYPDKIHLDSHERDLTATEDEWGRHFWEQDWRGGSDAELRASAWRQLAVRFGDTRAGWIARQLRPLNPQNRPASPVPANAALPVSPQFPGLSIAADDSETRWRHPPVARLMPDRWIAVVQSGGKPVAAASSQPITQPLQVGPDPKSPPPVASDTEVAIPEGMKWMLDFDAAVTAGMAIRVPIPAAVLSEGIDSLVVLGVSTSLSPSDTAKQMQMLLDGHHYTDGLDFLPQGTPTNNTTDGPSLFRGDASHVASFASEITRDVAGLLPTSNARALGAAAGLPPKDALDVLGRVPGGDASHELDARSMNTALWQTGLGYFLPNMIGADGTGLTFEDVTWARDHFTRHVRAGGPFPAIRCGRQPYGILPVTSLDLWKPAASETTRDEWLKSLLVSLRDRIWRPHLADVPRVGQRQSPPDADADLADVMRTDAVTPGFKARALLGRHYLQHLRAFVGEDLQATGFIGAQDALARPVLATLGFQWRPRVARGAYGDMAWRVSVPLVQAGEVSQTRGLDPNYITALLSQSTVAALTAAAPDDKTSLLQTLMRHALLREYALAAALIVGGATQDTDLLALLQDPELIDLVTDAAPTLTWNKQLDRVVVPVTGTKTIREFLEALSAFTAPTVSALGEWRGSAAHLQQLDSATLQFLMQGTLDLASHRLDAWITSLATKRLLALRTAAPQGVRVGAYGWVENLQQSGVETVAVPPPAGEQAPLIAYADDSGFIHAPSFTHAATGALLRNAHLGSGNAGQPDQPFAIDLSSRRARDAAWLLDAIRQGQPLGAVLGYRLERRLHDLGLHVFVQAVRELNPLSARKLQPSDQPVELIAAGNVVDGAALFDRWRQTPTSVTSVLQQAGATSTQSDGIVSEIRALGDAIDAVSDALIAEAAYQMVRGNSSRSATTLKAVAAGEAAPPELEVVRTPRTGTAITHRVVALLPGTASNPPGWSPISASARAAADPVLNTWAAKLLGDPSNVRCRVELLADSGNSVLDTRVFPMSDLSLTPLDVVYSVDLPAIETGSASGSALERRALYHARRGTGGFGDAARLRVGLSRPDDLAPGDRTLLDVIEQASAIRALLASARAIDPDDLQPSERASGGTIDAADLAKRVEHAEDALGDAYDTLGSLVQSGPAASVAALTAVLFKLDVLGFNGAVPFAAGADAAAGDVLRQQARVLFKDVAKRVKKMQELKAKTLDTDPRRRRDQLIARMRTVFGTTAAVSVRFRNDSDVGLELSRALAGSTTAQADDSLAVYTWFLRAQRVRDGLGRLAGPLRGAEIQGGDERLALQVAQVPYSAGDRWVGLPPVADTPLPHGKLSLVVHSTSAIDMTKQLSGLWIDEWVELVPGLTETTAVTFQYNAPDACPPQSVLLAVAPDLSKPWTVATLYRVLFETLDLAKLRAVPLDALNEIAHYLPASMLAFNAANDAVSTDPTPLTK